MYPPNPPLTTKTTPPTCTSQHCKEREKLLRKVVHRLNLISSWFITRYGNKDCFPPGLKEILNDEAETVEECPDSGGLTVKNEFPIPKLDPYETHVTSNRAAPQPQSIPAVSDFDYDYDNQAPEVEFQDPQLDPLLGDAEFPQYLIKPCSVQLIRISAPIINYLTRAHRQRNKTKKVTKPRIKRRIFTRTPKEHKCEFCGKILVNSYSLQTHRMTHTGETRYTCDQCGRKFIRGDAFKSHVRRHNKDKPYKCPHPTCFKAFACPNNLKQHQLYHTTERNYKCDRCPKAFRFAIQLRNHIPIHTGKGRFTCDVCGKGYESKQIMLTHRMTHSTEKPFKCEFQGCERTFKTPTTLQLHKKRIHIVTPHQCESCGVTFPDNYRLRRHQSVHLENKDLEFKCQLCGRGFSQKQYLVRHTETIHNPNRNPHPFKCELCPANYAHMKNLKTHRKKKHSQKYEYGVSGNEK